MRQFLHHTHYIINYYDDDYNYIYIMYITCLLGMSMMQTHGAVQGACLIVPAFKGNLGHALIHHVLIFAWWISAHIHIYMCIYIIYLYLHMRKQKTQMYTVIYLHIYTIRGFNIPKGKRQNQRVSWSAKDPSLQGLSEAWGPGGMTNRKFLIKGSRRSEIAFMFAQR